MKSVHQKELYQCRASAFERTQYVISAVGLITFCHSLIPTGVLAAVAYPDLP